MSVRILHLRASNFVGGPERQIFAYAAGVPQEEITTWIGTFTHGDEGRAFAGAARANGIPVWECSQNGVRGAVRALKQFLRDEQVAMVCTHGYKATIVALLACRAKNIPVVPFLRGWTGEDAKVRLYEAIEKTLLRSCTRVVALSEAHAASLRNEHSWAKDKVRVIANAATPTEAVSREAARAALQQRYGIGPTDLCVVSAGRLSPEKDPFTFVRSAQRIATVEPGAKFIVFGDGVLRDELTGLAASLGITDRVQFAGLVDDFRDLLSGCDLLINASQREQMPNVVLEAMTAGVAVVATAVGGVPELLADDAGVLTAPANDAAIASAAIALLADPAHRAQIAQNAIKRLRTHFSAEVQSRQLQALYSEVLPFVRFERPALRAYPKISVVMPVRNEEHHIGAVLARLLEQDYPADKFEIIVADGQSKDRTREIVAGFASRTKVRVQVVDNPAHLSSAGRNVGVRAGTGEIVAFIDGHCFVPGRHLLYDTARMMETTQADALARPQPLRAPWNDDFQDLVASVRESALGHGRDSTIYSMTFSGEVDPTSAGATYKRSLFDELGYYDETFDACEDVEFNHRVKQAAKRAFTDPSLAVFYVPRSSVRALIKQMKRYGAGRATLARKHRAAQSLSQYAPAMLLAYTLFLPLVCVVVPFRYGMLSLFPIFLYAVAVVAASAVVGFRVGQIGALAPLVFMSIHFGLGWGSWSKFLSSSSVSPHARILHQKTTKAASNSH